MPDERAPRPRLGIVLPRDFVEHTTHAEDGLNTVVRQQVSGALARRSPLRLVVPVGVPVRGPFDVTEVDWLEPASTADGVTRGLTELAATCDVVIAHDMLFRGTQPGLIEGLLRAAHGCTAVRFVAWTHEIEPADKLLEHRGTTWAELVRTIPDLSRLPCNVQVVFISNARRRDVEQETQLAGFGGHVVHNGLDVFAEYGISPRLRAFLTRLRWPDCDVLLFVPARFAHDLDLGMTAAVFARLRAMHNGRCLLVTTLCPDLHVARQRDRVTAFLNEPWTFSVADDPGFQPGGLLTNDEVRSLYRAADAVLFLSRREGFGMPMLEAATHRCVTVAMDTPISREVTGTSALLCRADEPPDAVAARLHQALTTDRSTKARQRAFRISEEFDRAYWRIVESGAQMSGSPIAGRHPGAGSHPGGEGRRSASQTR